jgi:hypothetical protein
LIRLILNTRNYLTNYDIALKNQAAKGHDLWKTTLKMEVIFQLQLLRTIGLKDSEIRQIFENGHSLKQKIA